MFIELECRHCGDNDMLSVEFEVTQLGVIGLAQAPLAAVIFVIMLVVIAYEFIPRALAGLVGVMCMLGLLVLSDKTPNLLEVVRFIHDHSFLFVFWSSLFRVWSLRDRFCSSF